MPIHHQIPRIGQEIFKYVSRAAPTGSRIMQSDKLLLNQAWKGFKHKSSIVSGIRTGLFGGSIVGSFIADGGDTPGNGSFPVNGTKTYPQNKTRGRSTRRSYCRNHPNSRSCAHKRRPYSGKRYRS